LDECCFQNLRVVCYSVTLQFDVFICVFFQDTMDFVAYVAKDDIHGRSCHVIECGGGLAQDVITTIGQAFELRFKNYLAQRAVPLNVQTRYMELFLLSVN